MSSTYNFSLRLEQLKGKRGLLREQLADRSTLLLRKKEELDRHIKAREIIRLVGQATQEQLAFHIEEIVTLAMRSVFPYPYEFAVKFELKNNRTECGLYLKDSEGRLLNPMHATGGGVVDVASFALRVASWSMNNPRMRGVLVLDEPFRYLSRDLLYKAGEMLNEVSRKLGLQIIMISHEEPLVDCASKVIMVSKNAKGRSDIG